MPRLSVIVPVYNTEKYLRECLDSILTQTYTDFELILVDDGSTDSSGAICDSYSRADSRIHVIHQQNGGVTAARKMGTKAAVGDYISFVDSDDWIAPDMFQQMLAKAEHHDLDMILCDMVVEKQGSSTVIRTGDLTGQFSSEAIKQQIYPHMLFDFQKNMPGLSLNLWNKLIKSTIVKSVLSDFPNHVTYGEDALASLICLLRSKCIYIMEDSAFYHYRQTEEFLQREQNISLLGRLRSFAGSTQIAFLRYHFDGTDQLAGYMAQVSLYCVRQILLFNNEYSLRKKFALVRGYFAEPNIRALLERSQVLVKDHKMCRKIKLVNSRRFRLLYGCFYAAEMIQRVKRNCRSIGKKRV